MQRKQLWCGGEVYEKHRIPGMLLTAAGTLLAYNEARRTAEDWALMDVLLQRSTDGGESFSDPVALACGTEALPTVNNPVMMQDKTGRIHFLYCECYGTKGGRIWQRTSDDDGMSWSEPRDITCFTAPTERTCFALGPGHGICLADGTLLVPVWLVPAFYGMPTRKHGPSIVTTFTSKDGGETWALGEWIWTNRELVSPNETAAAELSDGRVYLNLRSNASYRADAFSRDGQTAWEGCTLNRDLPDARCFGSLTTIKAKNGTRALVFANCADNDARRNVTLHLSFDDAKSWCRHILLDAEQGGYVEVAADDKREQLYVLYETDYGATDELVTIPYAELLA